MMVMSLCYSLLHPTEVQNIRKEIVTPTIPAPPTKQIMAPQQAITPKDNFQPEAQIVQQQVQQPTVAIPAPTIENQVALIEKENENLQPDPNPVEVTNAQQVPSFDLLSLLSEVEATDDELVLAASQVESAQTSTKSAVMKKNTLPNNQTFTNCTIGSINIHIHKN